MARGKVKAYKEQSFDHLRGLDGISDDQIAEHLKLYSGYVKQVNALNQELTELLAKGKASGKDPEFAELLAKTGTLLDYRAVAPFESFLVEQRRTLTALIAKIGRID